MWLCRFCALEEIMANPAPGGASDFNTKIVEEFRANEGRVGGPLAGAAMILIHHIGAKSGIERVSPLACSPQGGGLASIVAEVAGRRKLAVDLRNVGLTAQIDPADPEGAYQRIAAQVPLGRYGTAQEVANLVTWLLSDEASYLSGATHLIDGAINA